MGGTGFLSFECQQCGECCSHLGLVHTIKEERGEYRFLLRNEYTGEETAVTVDPDKVAIFLDCSVFEELPEACPFFRTDQKTGKAYCTVHLTRPEICRDYGCWRMLILDFRGRRAGRIMYQRHLVSDDATLTRLFEECIDPISEPDDAAWDDNVIRILARAGYAVRM
jgi:Fe-S-cluster containining protein